MEEVELIEDQEELHELLEVLPEPKDKKPDDAPYEDLLKYLLENKSDDIIRFIRDNNLDLQKFKYIEFDNVTILVIACIDDRVLPHTLDVLYHAVIQKYGIIDSVDDFWCGWEPLHYAASTANPEKLEVIIKHLKNLNTLTYFSENALHILLEYEKSVEPFTGLLHNGTETRICTFISQEKEEIIQCARILIENGVDINHTNFWHDSPISLAVRYRFSNVIELFLKAPYVDIDNCKEGDISLREFMKINKICLSSLPSGEYYQEDPGKILFNYIKCGDEDSFVEYHNENIKDYVDTLDGDNEFDTSGTMLQMCFRKAFLAYLQDDAYEVKLNECDILESPMLKVFSSKGLKRCIEHLLVNGADIRKLTRKFSETILEAAALRGFYPLVAILLRHRSCRITTDEIFAILPKLFDNKFSDNLNNYEFYRNHVLYLFLNKLIEGHAHEFLSPRKRTCLNRILIKLNLEADITKTNDSAIICQILALGASLTAVDKTSEKTVVERIEHDILSDHLDDSIDNNTFFYNSFIRDDNKTYSETKALFYLTNDPVKYELLTHPLLVNFIHKKWLRIYWFFTSVLVFYGFFVISICVYMLATHLNFKNEVIEIFFAILLGLQLLKELIQLIFLYRLKYFWAQSNYPELAVIISGIISLFYPNMYCTVISILISTVIFFAILGQLPRFTKYTLILGSIKYFLEYACFYFFMFVSFSISFYILFPYPKSGEVYSDLAKSLFDTLVLFTGEFNERVLQPANYPVFGRIVMTGFIFCMTIILNNLLVGLIVADMDKIQKDLRLYKQVKMAGFIIRTNSFVKRLHSLKWMDCTKSIINYIHLFKKGTAKKIEVSVKCNTFDDENKDHMKNLRNKKRSCYDKDILKKVYEKIMKGDGDKTKKNSKKG